MSRRITHWRPDIERARKQLDALPDRAVVIDAHGDAWQKSAYLDTWYRAFDGDGVPPSRLAQNVGAVTVAHKPTEQKQGLMAPIQAYAGDEYDEARRLGTLPEHTNGSE